MLQITDLNSDFSKIKPNYISYNLKIAKQFADKFHTQILNIL